MIQFLDSGLPVETLVQFIERRLTKPEPYAAGFLRWVEYPAGGRYGCRQAVRKFGGEGPACSSGRRRDAGRLNGLPCEAYAIVHSRQYQ